MEDNKNSETQVVEEETTQVVTETVVDTDVQDTKDSDNQVLEEEKVDGKPSDDDESQDDDDSDEDNEFTNALKKVRNEAKNLRKRLRDAEATIEQLRSESNDELVKERDSYKQQLVDLKAEVRTEKTRSQVVEAARKAGAIEPDAVADMLMSKIEYDDADKPTNVEGVVTNLKDTYKKLFGASLGNGNIGNRNERGSKYEGMNAQDLIRNSFKQTDD